MLKPLVHTSGFFVPTPSATLITEPGNAMPANG